MTAMPFPDDRRCASKKNNGDPCNVDAQLLIEDEDTPGVWWCFGHHPDYEDARDAARSKAGSRTALKYRKAPRYLDTHDLGALESAEDAQRWSEVIARAVVTGKLSANAAGMALKSVEQWLRSHETNDLNARLAELERRVANAVTKGGAP